MEINKVVDFFTALENGSKVVHDVLGLIEAIGEDREYFYIENTLLTAVHKVINCELHMDEGLPATLIKNIENNETILAFIDKVQDLCELDDNSEIIVSLMNSIGEVNATLNDSLLGLMELKS